MRLEQYNALRKTVETRFGTFEYAEAGDGPAALFIHGLFVSPYFWKDVIERLPISGTASHTASPGMATAK
jgi:hypothetical protein